MVGLLPSFVLRCCGSGRGKRALKHAYLFCKSVVALISAIICWLGVWEIWDLYLWDRTVLRDVLYVLVNSMLMLMCGTFLANCGIYEEESGDAAKEEETQQAMMRAIDAETETEEEAIESAHIDAIVAERRRSISEERIPSERPRAAANGNGTQEHVELSPTSPAMRARHDEPRAAEATNGFGHSAAPSAATLSRSSSLTRNGSNVSPHRLSSVDLIRVRHSESYGRRCLSLASQLCTCELFWKVYVASLVSLIASIGFWAGAYNLLLAFFLIVAAQHVTLSYALNLIVGWLLMWTTGTLFEQAGLSEAEPAAVLPAPAARSSSLEVGGRGCSAAHAWTRGKVYVRAILAITGTMAFWLGASMLLEELSEVYYSATSSGSKDSSQSSGSALHCDECTESTPTRNAVFILLGLLIFVITDTMAVHAGIEESNQSAASDASLNRSASVNPSLPAEERGRLVSGLVDSSGETVISRSSRCSRFLAHPVMRHVRALSSLTGVMILWEGIWDAAFTPEAERAGWHRMLIYTLVGLFGLMLTNSLFANSGVVPPFALAKRSQQVQQRLGAHLEEKKMERAAAGGYAHPEEVSATMQLQRQQQQLARQLESQMNHSIDALPDDRGLSPISPAPFNALRSDSSGSDRSPRSSVGAPSPVPTPPTDANGTLDSKVAFTQLQD